MVAFLGRHSARPLGGSVGTSRAVQRNMSTAGSHAIVLGASMGGLLAATVLSKRFARVTLVERDALPNTEEHRKGVPQGRHAHGLLTSGARVLEELLPGYAADLAAHGALDVDMSCGAQYCLSGVNLVETSSNLRSVLASRPLIESVARQHVSRLANVTVLDDCEVRSLVGNAERVVGAMVTARSGPSEERRLDADLVVDATGRGSRTPKWLQAFGLAPPLEEKVRIGVGYTTLMLRRRHEQLNGKRAVIVTRAPPNRRSGVALAVERDRWIVTLIGYLGDRAPTEPAAFTEYARTLPSPAIHRLLCESEPLGPALVAELH